MDPSWEYFINVEPRDSELVSSVFFQKGGGSGMMVDVMAGQPTPPGPRTPPRNKGLIAGLIKGNQWLISPDHKAGYFWGGYVRGG